MREGGKEGGRERGRERREGEEGVMLHARYYVPDNVYIHCTYSVCVNVCSPRLLSFLCLFIANMLST